MLGPSGCGKTTTLRMIAGFEEPTSGQILLHGRDMVGVPPFRRDVNMVFQQYALFPHMDVFENVAFGLRRKKVDKDEIRRRVAETLALVELEGREKRKPRQLSGGQQQRVALARALVNRPRALLLDEPLGALDLKLRQAMQLELKRIQREVGITFVYVTHDQEEALTMSDRLVVMNAGRIEQLGSPRELYEHPATRFVANFIGTSNILTGRLERRGDAWALAGLGPDERVLVADAGDAQEGQDVELAVRPEKVVLRDRAGPAATRPDRAPGQGRRGRLPGHLDPVPDGHRWRRRPSPCTVRTRPPPPERTCSTGQVGWLEWPPEHTYVLGGGAKEGTLP